MSKKVFKWIKKIFPDQYVSYQNGEIVTRLKDEDFFMLVMEKWAGYPENEAYALLLDGMEAGATRESALIREGFLVLKNDESFDSEICLKKVGDRRWVIDGYKDDRAVPYGEADYRGFVESFR